MVLLLIPVPRIGTGSGLMLRILSAIFLPISFTLFTRRMPKKRVPFMVRAHVEHPPVPVRAQEEVRGFRRYHLPDRIAVKRHTFEDLFPWESIRKHPREYRPNRVWIAAPPSGPAPLMVAPTPPPAAPVEAMPDPVAPAIPSAAPPLETKCVLVRCGPDGYEIRIGRIES
jgi:hypothetical protein